MGGGPRVSSRSPIALCTSLRPTWRSTDSNNARLRDAGTGPGHTTRCGIWPGWKKARSLGLLSPLSMGLTPSHPGPNMRLTVDPPEHIERWAAIRVRGQDIPQQPHLHRCWIRHYPRSWGLQGAKIKETGSWPGRQRMGNGQVLFQGTGTLQDTAKAKRERNSRSPWEYKFSESKDFVL